MASSVTWDDGLQLGELDSQKNQSWRSAVSASTFDSGYYSSSSSAGIIPETQSTSMGFAEASVLVRQIFPSAMNSWSWRSEHQEQPEEPSLIDDRFFDILQDGVAASKTLLRANEWYSQFLTQKVLDSWPLLVKTLRHVPQWVPNPQSAGYTELRGIITSILCITLEAIPRKYLALADIVDLLNNSGLLKEDGTPDMDGTAANQLAFALFGWLSKSKY